MDVTGVGDVAKNKTRGEVNIQSEDWDLVYQTLSANRSSTMFDMSVSDLFQLPFILCRILPFYTYLV